MKTLTPPSTPADVRAWAGIPSDRRGRLSQKVIADFNSAHADNPYIEVDRLCVGLTVLPTAVVNKRNKSGVSLVNRAFKNTLVLETARLLGIKAASPLGRGTLSKADQETIGAALAFS